MYVSNYVYITLVIVVWRECGPLELVGVMGNRVIDGEGACLEIDGDEGACLDIDGDVLCPEMEEAGVCLDIAREAAC